MSAKSGPFPPGPFVGDAFVPALLSCDSKVMAGLLQPFPRPASVSAEIKLLGGTKGGEWEARKLLIQVYAAHGLHEPGTRLMHAAAQAVAAGVIKERLVKGILRVHRKDLRIPLVRLAQFMQRSGYGFDYAALYPDLFYHCDRISRRWESEYYTQETP